MTHPHEPGSIRLKPLAEGRTSKGLKRDFPDYGWDVNHPHFQIETSAVPVNRNVAIGSVLDSWELLEHVYEASDAEILKSGAWVRERLNKEVNAVFGYSQRFDEIKEELAGLRRLLEALSAKAEQPPPVCVPLRAFALRPIEVAIPIDVVITFEDDGYQASFLDGNLHAYGDTQEEALVNIKETILETYRRLRELPDTQLGASMLRQKQVLNHHLREARVG